MDAYVVIDKYYKKDSDLYNILVHHSKDVTNKALNIIEHHPELGADRGFVETAAMLHDIGIFLTDAPSIQCHGILPYICHGYLGREILDREGFPAAYGLVCERHTGTGLTLANIINNKLPLPHRDMCPQTVEEKIICFSDCFFSKTKLGHERSVEEVEKSLKKFGDESVTEFKDWCKIFL